MRSANLYAASVEIECPHCCACQPNPDNGSFLWSVDQVKTHAGSRACPECAVTFGIEVTRPFIDAAREPAETECKTCLGVRQIRDGGTGDLRKCLDCNGSGIRDGGR